MSELVVKAKIKDLAKVEEKALNVSTDFYDGINKKVTSMIVEACLRARANGRNTVMATEIQKKLRVHVGEARGGAPANTPHFSHRKSPCLYVHTSCWWNDEHTLTFPASTIPGCADSAGGRGTGEGIPCLGTPFLSTFPRLY